VTAAAVLLTLASGGCLLARRRAPLLVLAATAALTAVLVVIDAYPGGAPVLVALFTVADLRDRGTSAMALVAAAALLYAGSVSSIPVSIGAWALGGYAQTRRRYVSALEDRAAQLERERAQLDALAAQQERTAIARELHDIVAHSVSVMLLGARGARDVLRPSPELAEQILRRVETSGEQSIAELRRILLVLRARPAGDGSAPGSTPGSAPASAPRPAPGLADLAGLVSDFRSAGVPVTLSIDGSAAPLPGGLELSVYRIVEEALTNVLRHSRPSAVQVQLRVGPGDVDLQVRDDGPPVVPAGPAPGGHGLVGMRERVSARGGSLSAGPLDEGGFLVTARMPIDGPA
jgi:signal transduction histidine kinase